MKKVVGIFLSLIPGAVSAQHVAEATKIRVTAQHPEGVISAISAIQDSSIGLGSQKVTFTVYNQQNAVEIFMNPPRAADALAIQLKGILGSSALVEKVAPQNMMQGTQDDRMGR